MKDSAQVAQALTEIATLLTLSAQRERDAGARFKARTFAHGAQLVRGLSAQLATLVTDGSLENIAGVGPSLARQITELWHTGTSSLLTRLRAEHPEGTAELAQLKGMTARRIAVLSRELGVTSIAELREACVRKRVRALSGFGIKTEGRLMAAIEAHAASDVPESRILLKDARRLAQQIAEHLDGLAEVQLSGAARRGEETVRQLDLHMVSTQRARVFEALATLPSVAHIEPEDGTGYLAAGVPLRVHVSPPHEAGAGLLASTGSFGHLHALRRHAVERGLKLDDGGRLFEAKGSPIATASSEEHTLYAALGLAVVPPELRTGDGELQRAAHGGFTELVQVHDLRGMVHCHTTHSDGKHSVEEMARAAKALGMQYITITDHSKSAQQARGLSVEALKRQWDDIAEAERRVGIRVLRGIESDILADGSLDYPDSVLEQLDIVIASIHARHGMNRADMTERLVRAMQLPVFKVWGHALGRILLQREPSEMDVPRVLDALAGSRGAVELNSEPHRLDLPPVFIPEARARGIPFVISVDAHSTAGLSTLDLGVLMARRGGVPRSEVLNALPADEFMARVRPVA